MTGLLLTAILLGADPDVVIRNTTIYDGTGAAPTTGDVLISGEKITAIGKVEVTDKTRVIDGKGLILAPGFIDLHTHCDTGEHPLTGVKGKANLCYLTQGVTTVVTGNCGSGPTDMNDYFSKLEKGGVGTNVIHQIPHNSIRSKVMGNVSRAPTEAELHQLEEIADKMMKDGAWGLSTGLIYTPGTWSKTEELIALAKIAAKHKGFYASHIRDEGAGLLTAIEETLKIGRDAGLPVHISHIKCSGRAAHNKAADAIALIEKARKDGQIVSADQYPYIASSTSLSATVIPSRFRDGTAKEYQARLADPEASERIRKAIEGNLGGRDGGKGIVIARYKPQTKWQGKSLKEIAELEKTTPVEIVMQIEKAGGAAIVNFGMKEEDVRLYMKQSFVATASDGSSQVPGESVPHPRSYGTFPRKIGRYAIEEEVLPLSQAIRSASGLPADILRLKDRGYVKSGNFADLVIFDPKTFRDVATFDKPHQYATGVKYLFVNGKLVIEDGKVLDVLAGKPLRWK